MRIHHGQPGNAERTALRNRRLLPWRDMVPQPGSIADVIASELPSGKKGLTKKNEKLYYRTVGAKVGTPRQHCCRNTGLTASGSRLLRIAESMAIIFMKKLFSKPVNNNHSTRLKTSSRLSGTLMQTAYPLS